MAKVLIIIFGLSLIIERVTEKLLYLLPVLNKKIYAWIISTVLGLLICFLFRFGIIGELGLSSSSHVAHWVDYLITGILVASGSEPVHSIVDALSFKRDELKRKSKNV
jgi:hypothetical protein